MEGERRQVKDPRLQNTSKATRLDRKGRLLVLYGTETEKQETFKRSVGRTLAIQGRQQQVTTNLIFVFEGIPRGIWLLGTVRCGVVTRRNKKSIVEKRWIKEASIEGNKENT